MTVCCENCRKAATCKKTIGIMFGFCTSDFVPASRYQRERAAFRAWLKSLEAYEPESYAEEETLFCRIEAKAHRLGMLTELRDLGILDG